MSGRDLLERKVMTVSTSANHGGDTPAGLPFAPNEVNVFHAEDRTAATHIVGLLLSIFALGVVGYLVVALWCDGVI